MGVTLKNQPYGNWQVLNLNGELIFRCSEKKANWYLKRSLAKIQNEKIIQLTFETAGNGNQGNSYLLKEKENKCCVCGATKNLTKHHVVPHGYRKYFPEKIKSRASYDVVALCIDCHKIYEKEAFKLKKLISDEFFVPVDGVGLKINIKIRGIANAILKHKDKIPKPKLEFLMDEIKEFHEKNGIISLEEIAKLPIVDKLNYVNTGKLIVEKIQNLDEFIKRWRTHFIDTMKPKFLEGWKI